MKILLLSYGNIEYDGRLRALVSVFSEIGDLRAIVHGEKSTDSNLIPVNRSYLPFISKSIRIAKSLGHIDWMVLDNRKATIPGLILLPILKPEIVIQDCRELYLLNETKSLPGRIGCIFEKIMARRATVVICANEERAAIMKKEFGLKTDPVPYENLRQLQAESDEEWKKAEERFDNYFGEKALNIISSSGCSIQRTNDILIKNLSKINRRCRVFLVGDSDSREEQLIREIADNNRRDEVVILGKLNQTELKYLIKRCDIGVVNYGQYDTNNKYCASGKLYEFVFEGLPVITTSNPPLKRLCDTWGIGEADDLYYNGINKISDKYDDYVASVNSFAEQNTIKDNDRKLIEAIRERITHKG